MQSNIMGYSIDGHNSLIIAIAGPKIEGGHPWIIWRSIGAGLGKFSSYKPPAIKTFYEWFRDLSLPRYQQVTSKSLSPARTFNFKDIIEG